MKAPRTLWLCAFVLWVGCPRANDTDRAAAGGGAGTSQGAGGNVSGTSASAGTSGSTGGTGISAAGSGGGAGSSGRTGAAGMPEAGRGSAAASGAAGGGGAGAGGAAGGGCTQNLACKLTAPASTGDVKQDCVDRINQFRTQCACLPPLARWNDGEACADMMAEHDSMTMQAHSGFTGAVCTPGGNAQNECPKYGSETQVISTCLQQMWNEGPPPTATCKDACFQMYGHFINMTNTRYKKVACGFHTTSGGSLWAVQNFSP